MRGDDLGLLHGLPVGIKDLQATKGLRTTWGSLLHKDTVPDYDDPVVANVRSEGRHHLLQDQHAGIRRRCEHHQPRVRPDRQSLSIRTRPAADPPAGRASPWRRAWFPWPPDPITGAACAPRRRFAVLSGSGPRPVWFPAPRGPSPFCPCPSSGPWRGRSKTRICLLLAQLDLDKDDPFSSDDRPAHSRMSCPASISVRSRLPSRQIWAVRRSTRTSPRCSTRR